MIDAVFRGESRILKIVLNAIGLAAVVLLILKAPYGYGTTDECYYLITPLRLVQGDAPLVDEWFSAQLFGVVMFPLLKLYMLIVRSTTGIILAFRYIYIAVKILASIYIYRKLHRICDIFPAFVATLLFLIHSPFNIMALSYNSIGMIALAMTGVTLASLRDREWYYSIISGFLFAIAVICCPYLALAFIVYTAAMIIMVVARKRSILFLRFMEWLRFVIGVAFAAVLFCILVLSRTSVKEILQSLPHIFSDPTHQSLSVFESIKTYFDYILIWDRKRALILVFILVICIICICVKQLRKYRGLVFMAALLLTVVYVILPGYPNDLPNYYIFQINIAGLASFLLLKKRPVNLFAAVWVIGFLYTFAIHLASNQTYSIISSASIVPALASVIFIFRLVCELKEDAESLQLAKGMIPGCLALAVVAAQVCVIAVFVARMCFWDDDTISLSSKIDIGCEKGIITSQGYAEEYTGLWNETESIRILKSGRVMYMSWDRLWLTLDDAKPVGSCFSYYVGTDEYRAQELKAYYEMHPDKKADHYYFAVGIDTDIMSEAFGLDAGRIQETPSGDHILIGDNK